MLQLLINILTSFLVPMGVSQADIESYVNLLGNYIYGILGALLLLIVILIGAHWLKKGSRGIVRWTSVIAFVVALVMIVNSICYGPMYSLVSMYLNASKVEIADDVVANSLEVITRTAEEGMVLVKNEDLLPLPSSTKALNVFGWASAHPVVSGTGSAASGDLAESTIGIIQSLNDAGYATNDTLTNMYREYGSQVWGGERPVISMSSQDWSLPEPTMDYYTDAVMGEAKAFSDTAVIVLARSGGENADLPSDMAAVINGTYDVANTLDNNAFAYTFTKATFYNNTYGQKDGYDEFLPGDHYLQPSQTELKLIDLVTSNFENVIVVINANNTMELGWVNAYPSIKSVILAPGTGTCGMTALGEIINGTVNPSGHTADTYLYDLTTAPTWNHSGNSGNHLYSAKDLVKTLAREDVSFNGVISFVDYVEGIYMGYKFYETAAEEGLIDYEETVQYPFGYGLSYTTFSQEITDLKKDDTSVTVTVKVTNTGSVAGKDAVELYYTAPYTNGGIEKAAVNLIDFEKTSLLEPGKSETITLTVSLEDMASYDSSCIKTENGGYVLEAGEYTMSIRSDSHTVLDSKTFTVSSDVIYNTASNQFDDIMPDHAVLSRKDSFANYKDAIAAPADSEYELSKDDQKYIKSITSKYKAADYQNADDVMPTTGADNGLTLADMTGLSYEDEKWELLLDQMSPKDMENLINNGGWQTVEIKSIGKRATNDCDGPSGLSNYVTKNNGTQYTAEVMMAQTWSKEIAHEIGSAMGQEFAAADNYGWYGPAMNLHRSAFSGRNFEYYSEDAVLSGIFASQEVNGAAQWGVYPYIKHFASNDQETNRTAFLTTWMTEQTLRENCLKPFQMVIENFDFDNNSMGVMTAYNWLGYTPIISNGNLLNNVLRGEWGFKGMVISDYNGGYGYQFTDAAIRNGNDLMLSNGETEAKKLDTQSATVVLNMRQACKNILYTIANSGYYKTAEVVEVGAVDNMGNLFNMINTGTAVGAAALEILGIAVWLLLKKKNAAKTK